MDILTLAVALGYTKKQVEEAKREGFRVQVEQDRSILETTGEEKVFYFLPKNPQKTKDGYDEFIYTNNDWEQVGVTDIDLSAYALKSEIPAKVSQLQNDSGYLTEHQDISGKADKATTLAGYGITDGQQKIDSNNKLSSDLVDDSNQTNKFVTTSEKTTWGAKYDKPNSGIPKIDLSEEVQTSLGKADTALQTHQDISGKADKATTLLGYGITDAQSLIDNSHKLSSDLVDDTNQTNKFVTENDKTSWSAKYDKPSGGIPSTDLSNDVQTSLGKADTALQSYTEQYTGTITGITMNGESKGTSGVVDLGTVLTAHQDISGKADKATTLSGYGITDAYTKTEIDTKLSAVYKYKGTVATYQDLPSSDLTNGDVYNVETDGSNYAWTGSAWDKLGGDIDLSGYQTKIDSSHKLSGDLIDDTNSTNKFVTSNEKTAWAAKYDKPSGGIPATDLDSSVQTSLGKADTALQSYTEQYTGTVTGVTMNGNSLSPTDGVIDLGTVITAHQDISGKASIENGVIDSDNVAWYTQEEQGYIITGAYTILGNICILNATAKCVPTWERVYYSLPVASVASSTTVALSGSNIYSIATGTLDNISVLEIKQAGTTSMDDSTIHFTLIYKC